MSIMHCQCIKNSVYYSSNLFILQLHNYTITQYIPILKDISIELKRYNRKSFPSAANTEKLKNNKYYFLVKIVTNSVRLPKTTVNITVRIAHTARTVCGSIIVTAFLTTSLLRTANT